MDTAEALKQAMQAVRDAGIPEELWPTALQLALADLRGYTPGTAAPTPATFEAAVAAPATTRRATTAAPRRGGAGANSAGDQPGILATAAANTDLLERVARQTETKLEDLTNVFHVENGALRLKVVPRNLGSTDKAKTMTVTALVGGAVFAGTNVPSIPFPEIHDVCKEMRCYSVKHAAEYVRETAGFGSIGSGKASALTHKTGWETEFSKAVDRVLGRSGSDG